MADAAHGLTWAVWRILVAAVTVKIDLVLRVIHHEVVIRWDIGTEDESADVVPNSTLSDTWRTIAADHINLPSTDPTLQVIARSWAD